MVAPIDQCNALIDDLHDDQLNLLSKNIAKEKRRRVKHMENVERPKICNIKFETVHGAYYDDELEPDDIDGYKIFNHDHEEQRGYIEFNTNSRNYELTTYKNVHWTIEELWAIHDKMKKFALGEWEEEH